MSLKPESYQLHLGSQFLNVHLNPSHELVILADRIDWDSLVYKLKRFFQKHGRKAKRIRLMVGLLFLKHLHNLSDRLVVGMVHENIYYKYLCGLQWDLSEWASSKSLDPSTLTKFRRRLGKEGMKIIEDMIKSQLYCEKRISKRTQFVDTTAQEKNIAYPTDSNLLARGIRRLVKTTNKLKRLGLSVNVRSYKRLVRKEILRINKLGRGRKDRIATATRNLIKYARQVRKVASIADKATKKRANEKEQRAIDKLKDELRQDSQLVDRVIQQGEARLNDQKISAKEKVFSMHEPHTTVIAKGKRRSKYEFGAKVSLSADRNHFIVGHQEYSENIADVNSLDAALEDWEKTFGDLPDELGADRGYHTSNLSERASKIKHLAIQSKGNKLHPDHNKPHFKRLQRRRNTLEAVIGHLKTDHRMNRCRYKGEVGDTINVGLAVTAWNLRKWARQLRQEMKKSA